MTGESDPNHAIRNLKRGVGAGALLLAVAVALLSWQTWRSQKAASLRQFSSLVEVGANSLDSYFAQLESGLVLLGEHFRDPGFRPGDERAGPILQRFRQAYPDLRNIGLFRPDGAMLADAFRDYGHTLAYSANDSKAFVYFRDVVSKERNFEISRPIFSRRLNEWIVALRYGVRDAKGNLRYVIGAALPLARTQGFWKQAVLPQGGALALLRDDGYLVSRYPVPDATSLEEVYGRPRSGALVAALQARGFEAKGIVAGRSSLSGVSPQLVYVFRRLPHYPVTFVMTIPERNFFTWWWEIVRFQYLIMLFVVAGSVLIYRWLLTRQTEWVLEREAAHRELERASRTDPLTGILNRRAAIEELNRELPRSVRTGQAAALVAFDLDHFKAVNDRYGHATGDRTLQMFVRVIRGEIRPYDVLGRFGGEEFVLLLPNTNARGAMITAERIRAALERERDAQAAAEVTVSAGVADSLEEGIRGDIERILAVSDARLYEAKRRRNCVVGPS